MKRLFRHMVTLAVLLTPVSRGLAEGGGDAVIRGSFGGSEIVITTTARLAGAIHSVTWKGKEYIDSADHGRQLQSACSFDNTAEAGAETFNPTEAGSRLDGAGPHSTSRLLAIQAEGQVLRTRTQLAFWLAPGERSAGQLARNASLLSNHVLEKEVRLGYRAFPNVLDYAVTFIVPEGEQHRDAQFEALTGYMPAEFERFWSLNPETHKLAPLSDGPGEQPHPVAFSTADGAFAMGIMFTGAAPAGSQPPSYGRFRFSAEKVTKWNCVLRVTDKNELKPGRYSARMLVPIGTLADVESTLAELAK